MHDCNVQAAAAAAGAVATADASPLRVRESVSPGFEKERMHSALGCVEHTRERCESEASTLPLPPAPSLPLLLLLLLPIPRAPSSSGFESAVPSGGVGALPEGTAWG